MNMKRYLTMPGTAVRCAVAAALLTASCVENTLYNTPHPDRGSVTLTLGDGAPAGSYTAAIDTQKSDFTTSPFTFPALLTPGSYTLAVWNAAEKISVTGTTAAVAPASGNWDGVGSFIDGAPGELHTCVQQVQIVQDSDNAFTASMEPQTRELTLVIEPTGDAAGLITEVVAYLSGAAGTFDFATGSYGAASNVALPFTRITSGADAGKWTATVRLLGTAGSQQKLTAEIRYADNNPRPTTLDSDLTASLAAFNDDKREPLTLGGTLVETPEEAEISGFGIIGWETITGGDASAVL